MPNRQAAALAERRGAAAAVLTLIGTAELVRFGFVYGTVCAHIEGPNGPRGGRRTLCGLPRRNYWCERDLGFPLSGNRLDRRDETRWRHTCADCKAALGA